MKQTVVIKVSMSSQKSRTKAMKIAVGASGVESATLKGDDKNQIEVKGDGIDAAELTRLLKKKLGYALLESVSAATSDSEDGDKEKENEENEAKMQVVYPTNHSGVPLYHDVRYVISDPYYEPNYSCSIM